MYTFTLDAQSADLVFEALADRPIRQAANLFLMLQQQRQAQDAAAADAQSALAKEAAEKDAKLKADAEELAVLKAESEARKEWAPTLLATAGSEAA